MINEQHNSKVFVTNLNLKNWFTKVGQTTITTTNNLKYANSFKNGVLIWISELEYKNDQWEELRIKLVKTELWNNEFNNIKTMVYNEFKKNSYFLRFARDVKTIYNTLNKNENINFTANVKQVVEQDMLAFQLPIMGYFGETLLKSKSTNYYTKEIEYYKKGYFVCEHINDKFLIY